jgi:hypothetical protein
VKLLDKNELTRLGSKSGASEVKQHKWFSKINWGLLRHTQPPVSSARQLLSRYIIPTLGCGERRVVVPSGHVVERRFVALRDPLSRSHLSVTIKHVVFDVRSSVRHKGVGDDGVMVFVIRDC